MMEIFNISLMKKEDVVAGGSGGGRGRIIIRKTENNHKQKMFKIILAKPLNHFINY